MLRVRDMEIAMAGIGPEDMNNHVFIRPMIVTPNPMPWRAVPINEFIHMMVTRHRVRNNLETGGKNVGMH